ncbi:SHOCT domain-containing protein [Demequina capsici]|uniref:SHOCT domain-containing protein n=1 Tax=Demequina capsici TaxID=3075620 RepID=A0AA96F4W8_9MICO|nr:SHOCT domain-containing protein [Demequina sp. OYTSA14]WNM23928.1 SHOCT domain-containing protein [Demequina sp. OYTSA14]
MSGSEWFAERNIMMGYWGWGHGYGMYGMGGWGLLWGLLLMAGLAALVYVAVRLGTRAGDQGTVEAGQRIAPQASARTQSSAREILESRLAKGEIDADEFRARVNALEGA